MSQLGPAVATLLIDNYDSFTYNLFQMLAVVNGVEPLVVMNDDPAWSNLDLRRFDNVVVSPGPGNPQRHADLGEAGRVVQEASLPTFGVCLGHQAICHFYGATVDLAPMPMHGRISQVRHEGDELFAGIPTEFDAVRYHSLAATNVAGDLEPIAYADDGVLMAVRHRTLPLWGVQYHPESIGTQHGFRLLENFRDLSVEWNANHGSTVVAPSSTHVIAAVKSDDSRTRPLKVCSVVVDDWIDSASVFASLYADSETAFWLDSAQPAEGFPRFSYMGDASGPIAEVLRYDVADNCVERVTDGKTERIPGSILSYLDQRMSKFRVESHDLPFSFQLGFVGYLGYEVKAETGGNESHVAAIPDATFVFADRMIVFDHQEQRLFLVALEHGDETQESSQWFERTRRALMTIEPQTPPVPPDAPGTQEAGKMRHSRDAYLDLIARCQKRIREGESYEICLTNMFEFSPLNNPLATYLALRAQNPAPFASYFRFSECSILSASPERMLRADEHGWVEAKPIKGTAPRGRSPVEDAELRKRLQSGEKDRAENLMIVDLLRNDLGRVCEIGTVSVPRLFDVESFATVHHLVSTIVGKLRVDRSNVDCLRSVFPGGSMTGAPKIRTMQILDDLEAGARGVYSGAIGYLSLNGAMDWSVVIRTIVNTPNAAYVGVGGAIIAMSEPQAEFDETLLKANALLAAVAYDRSLGS